MRQGRPRKPRRKLKTRILATSVTQDEGREFDAMAAYMGTTTSELIRKWAREKVRRFKLSRAIKDRWHGEK